MEQKGSPGDAKAKKLARLTACKERDALRRASIKIIIKKGKEIKTVRTGLAPIAVVSPPKHKRKRKPLKEKRGKELRVKSNARPLDNSKAATSAHPLVGLAAKLSKMRMRDTVTLWQNAIRILSDDNKRALHAEAQKAINALNDEWQRRRKSPTDEHFQWPTTEANPGQGGLETAGWLEEGILKYVGYTVGNANGEPKLVRERILTEVFSRTLPPAFPEPYLDEWGDPLSSFRLRKMAETIAAFARNGKRQRGSRMATAIRDWEADLDFLYWEYYVGKFHFAWPSSL